MTNNVQAFLFLILLRNIINKGFPRVYFNMRETVDFLLIEKAMRRRSYWAGGALICEHGYFVLLEKDRKQ